jgi:hypothetical protein
MCLCFDIRRVLDIYFNLTAMKKNYGKRVDVIVSLRPQYEVCELLKKELTLIYKYAINHDGLFTKFDFNKDIEPLIAKQVLEACKPDRYCKCVYEYLFDYVLPIACSKLRIAEKSLYFPIVSGEANEGFIGKHLKKTPLSMITNLIGYRCFGVNTLEHIKLHNKKYAGDLNKNDIDVESLPKHPTEYIRFNKDGLQFIHSVNNPVKILHVNINYNLSEDKYTLQDHIGECIYDFYRLVSKIPNNDVNNCYCFDINCFSFNEPIPMNQNYTEEELTVDNQNINLKCFVIQSENNPNKLCYNYLKHIARYIPTTIDKNIFDSNTNSNSNIFIELKQYAGKDKYGDFYGDDYVEINKSFKLMTPKPDYYSDNHTEGLFNDFQSLSNYIKTLSIKNFGINSKDIVKKLTINRREISNWN